jgi:UDP-2-acetamido-2,6-beta-L-arabino-hexul-4-ose reductase
MKILITGSNGFLGKNLAVRIREVYKDAIIETLVRGDAIDSIEEKVVGSDVIFHLAGENRPDDVSCFERVNVGLTKYICEIIQRNNLHLTLVYASSVQSSFDSPYGTSKRSAEKLIEDLVANSQSSAYIYKLPGVFGKWAKPNYNSVVATFCHNISRQIPIQIDCVDNKLSLVYVDDVIGDFIKLLDNRGSRIEVYQAVSPIYELTVGELAQILNGFYRARKSLVLDGVGRGLKRALYSTYLSYMPISDAEYSLIARKDVRGSFVELFKSNTSGQCSVFTLGPGLIRGNHYHHTKTEKFYIFSGRCKFTFRNIISNEVKELYVSDSDHKIVETIPGWVHSVENIGNNLLLVVLWANELFDPLAPDTIAG